MRIFILTVLPEQSAQVPVLTKNVTLDFGEDRPRQNSTLVFPFPKVQGRQMCTIAHPHPHNTSGSSTSATGATPTRASAPSFNSAATAAATASISLCTPYVASTPSADAAASYASPTDHIRQRNRQERSHIPPTLQLE